MRFQQAARELVVYRGAHVASCHVTSLDRAQVPARQDDDSLHRDEASRGRRREVPACARSEGHSEPNQCDPDDAAAERGELPHGRIHQTRGPLEESETRRGREQDGSCPWVVCQHSSARRNPDPIPRPWVCGSVQYVSQSPTQKSGVPVFVGLESPNSVPLHADATRLLHQKYLGQTAVRRHRQTT